MSFPPHILRELPGLEVAFDGSAMRGQLEAALFGTAGPAVVESCVPGRPLFLAGEGCTLQYECEVREAARGTVFEPIVVGRVFPDRADAVRYMREKLAPLVERVRGRADLAMFASPAALIEPLHMVVHVWPLDGELPTLVDATDPRHMHGVLREALSGELTVEELRIELVSYRRRSRCVLRYVVAGGAVGSGKRRDLVIYGKLTPRGDDVLYGDTLAKLRHFFERRDGGLIRIPRSLGWRPDLGLALLEEVAGEAKIGTSLRARLRNKPRRDGPTLEAMLATGARVAAALHRSGLPLGRGRTLEHRIADLENEVEITRLFSAEFADRASGWLQSLEGHARRSEPIPPCLCHGDFKYAQLLFDGGAVGIVDMDTLCQAEPAFDLGQFFAYLRGQARMLEGTRADSAAVVHELNEGFLGEYAAATGLPPGDEPRLRFRTALHEVASLLRVALHSQQKLKQTRLDSTSALIEERLSGLA